MNDDLKNGDSFRLKHDTGTESVGYNRRRKTMTFLQRKNAGTESELSEARRTKVPALGSWM